MHGKFMKRVIKLKDNKSFNTAFCFLEGNGFCFRARKDDSIVEFYYEYAMNEFISMCNNTIGLEDKFEVVG